MKILTIAALLSATLFLNHSHAQQLLTKKDPFSGKTTKTAITELGGIIKIGQQVGFSESDGKKYVSFIWISKTPIVNFDAFDIEKCAFLVKMQNDSVFRFKPDLSLSKKLLSGTIAYIVLTTPITDEQLKLLSANKIAIMRFAVNEDNGLDLTFTENNGKEIQKSALYVLN